jgi:hypothetical protein
MKAAKDTTKAINQGLALGFQVDAGGEEATVLNSYFVPSSSDETHLRNGAFRFYYKIEPSELCRR